MALQRIPLAQAIQTRDGTLTKDSKCVNGYWESSPNKKEFVKRPGLLGVTTSPALPTAQAQGIFLFNSFLYIAINNVIYKVDPSTYARTTVGTMTGTIGGVVQNCYFINTLNNTYLFVHNQVNGYVINGSTGAFSQVTNDKVSSTTVVTSGSNYSNGVTVSFSAPPSGTTATGTVQLTSGGVTNVTITNAGTGYVTAPTLTFTPASNVGPVTVTNTSGTYILTAASISGTVYVGMSVTGTGIPASTKVTAISGAGPYTITLNNATTSAVTSATFKDLGSGASATCLLNAFPSIQLGTGSVYLDTYTIICTTTGRIYSSGVNDPTTWNALNYITAESDPDNLKGIVKHLNYIMAFGEHSTEFFYDAGNYPGSPLASAPSYKMEIGCANGDSIQQFEQSVIWLGQSKAEGPAVYLVDGVAPVKVSSSFVDRILQNSNLTTVRSYTFKLNGHMFYLLTLHDLNVTIVYDVAEKTWYQWTMWAVGNGDSGVSGIYAEQYFRPSYFAAVGNKYFVLDDDNGSLYLLSDSYYNDANAPIYYRAVTQNIDNGSTHRKFYNRVEIVGDKIPAIMNIRNTNDDYKTWSAYRSIDLNKLRSQIYQCGQSRRRAWEFLCTDNQPLRIEAVEIDFEVGGLEQQVSSQ